MGQAYLQLLKGAEMIAEFKPSFGRTNRLPVALSQPHHESNRHAGWRKVEWWGVQPSIPEMEDNQVY